MPPIRKIKVIPISQNRLPNRSRKRNHAAADDDDHTSNNNKKPRNDSLFLTIPNELLCVILEFIGSHDWDTLMHLSCLCRSMRQRLQRPLLGYMSPHTNNINERIASVCLDSGTDFNNLDRYQRVLMNRFSVCGIRIESLDGLRDASEAKRGKMAFSIRYMTVKGSLLAASSSNESDSDDDDDDYEEGESTGREELLSLWKSFSNVESLLLLPHSSRHAAAKSILSRHGCSQQQQKPNIFPRLKKLSVMCVSSQETVRMIQVYGPQLQYLELGSQFTADYPRFFSLASELPVLQKLTIPNCALIGKLPATLRHLRVYGEGTDTDVYNLPKNCQLHTLELFDCGMRYGFQYPTTLKALSLHNCSTITPPSKEVNLEYFLCNNSTCSSWKCPEVFESLRVLSFPVPVQADSPLSGFNFEHHMSNVTVLEVGHLEILDGKYQVPFSCQYLIVDTSSCDTVTFSPECFKFNLKEIIVVDRFNDMMNLCCLVMKAPNLASMWIPKDLLMKSDTFCVSDSLFILTELFSRAQQGRTIVTDETDIVWKIRQLLSVLMADPVAAESLVSKRSLTHALQLIEEKHRQSLVTPQIQILCALIDTFTRAEEAKDLTCVNIVWYTSIADVNLRKRQIFAKCMDREAARFVSEEEKNLEDLEVRVASMLG